MCVRALANSHVLQAGDVLHAVDGKNVIGMNKMEVASLLMGPAGSKVRLRFLRQDATGNGSCYKGVCVRACRLLQSPGRASFCAHRPRSCVPASCGIRTGARCMHVCTHCASARLRVACQDM